jgi:5-(carboxyamino)imidazole ribonucleotide synthase
MTVGIVGAGQLGRMLALAGYPLGLEFLFLDPAREAPAGQVAPQICGEFTDRTLLARLARETDVLTFDWENISVAALRKLPPNKSGKRTSICPPVNALAVAQDRVREKHLFERLSIPTTRWQAVESHPQLVRAVQEIGLPGVLKTRRLGYDGKGQRVLRHPQDVQSAWDALGNAPLLYEELVPFDYEVSIIGARSRRGEVVVYPLNGNVHAGGILRLTRAPYGPVALQRLAARYLRRALGHFRYAGILTIEFFVRRGRLIANEIAPRVHNSGHWTIEGAETSQFENHLRAILGMPLGATRARGHCAMINLIGEMPPKAEILAVEGVHLHDYAKAPRPGRKLGHLTLVERSAPVRDP